MAEIQRASVFAIKEESTVGLFTQPAAAPPSQFLVDSSSSSSSAPFSHSSFSIRRLRLHFTTQQQQQ